MNVLLVGSQGNMGKRYSTIMGYLGVNFYRRDKGVNDISDAQIADKIDRIIITTPTDTHEDLIRWYRIYKKPILCEKPLVKDAHKTQALLKESLELGCNVSMVMQYRELVESNRIGWSYYNYFKTGSDGLAWDCIQIVGLARGKVDLGNDSPIWRCRINSQLLSLGDMDRAYLKFIEKWLKNPKQDHALINDMHARTQEMADSGTFRR